MVRARSPLFCTGLTTRRSTVSSSLSRASHSAWLPPQANGRIPAFVDCSGPGDDHPCDPGDLGRQRDGDLVQVHPGLQPIEPAAEAIPDRSRCVTHDRAPWTSSRAHVAVAALADTEQRGLAAGRVFPRHEAKPGGEVAGLSELPAVADGSEQCRGAERADAREWSSAGAHDHLEPRWPSISRSTLRDPLLEPREVLEQLASACAASPA